MFRILNRAYARTTRNRPGRLAQIRRDELEREIWLVSTRRPGHVNQCLALIEALGRTPDWHIEIPGKSRIDSRWKQWTMKRRVEIETVFRLLFCARPSGALIICSGRSIIPLCRAWDFLGRKPNFCVYVGTPKSRLAFADCLVRARHEALADEDRGDPKFPVRFHRPVHEIIIEGVPTRSLCARRAHPVMPGKGGARRLHVVIGGPSPGFSYEGSLYRKFLDQLGTIARAGGWVVAIITSARTSIPLRRMTQDHLAAYPVEWHDQASQAEFATFMAQADALVVCPDSITMVCEACRVGVRVFVPQLDLVAQAGPHLDFLARFVAEGWILPFACFPGAPDGCAPKSLPDQAKIAAAALSDIFRSKKAGETGAHKSISPFFLK